jgi:hypothetical protein
MSGEFENAQPKSLLMTISPSSSAVLCILLWTSSEKDKAAKDVEVERSRNGWPSGGGGV